MERYTEWDRKGWRGEDWSGWKGGEEEDDWIEAEEGVGRWMRVSSVDLYLMRKA